MNEIVGHLLDDEIATGWRYRQMIENDGALLAGFSQESGRDLAITVSARFTKRSPCFG